MRVAILLSLCLVVSGCGRSAKNYELDGNSFTSDYLRMVGQYTGINFPSGSRGLNLLYKGNQINAELLSKIEIPANSEEAIAAQLNRLPHTDEHVRSSLPSEVSWWTAINDKVRREWMVLNGHNLIHAIITDQNGRLILYCEWYQ